MNILITGVGGPTPRSFAIALKKYSKYKDTRLFATDVNPLSVGLYQNELFEKSYLVPKASDGNYWEEIERIITDNAIEYAVVMPEAEVLEWGKRKTVGPLPCKVLIPDFAVTNLLVDKARMTEVLKDLTIVPESVEFSREDKNLHSVPAFLGFPFWVRSSSGTSGLGSLKVDSLEALHNWISINPGVKKFLASKYLSGRNLACKLLYYNGDFLRAACAERVTYIMAKVAPSGITGNTSFGRFLNEPKLVDIANRAMHHLFTSANILPHGFFTVDFKEDEKGVPFITEINVRHVAFTQCFAAAGANFAEDTIGLLLQDDTFNKQFQIYTFSDDLIFLRDVDSLPILMKERDLIR